MMSLNFSIKNHTIHLWRAHLAELSVLENPLLMTLSPDEIQRANRFHFPHHRLRFILARGILRQILSLYTQIPPDEIMFNYGPRGKPALQNHELKLQFNLSHSEDFAVYALTHAMEVGVDIQKREEKYNEAIAERFFSQKEYADLHQLPESEQALGFCRLWACKEALIKVVGEGLYVPLGNFSVSLQEKSQWVTLTHEQHTQKYYLENFFMHSDYQSAFATDQIVNEKILWEWTSDGPAKWSE